MLLQNGLNYISRNGSIDRCKKGTIMETFEIQLQDIEVRPGEVLFPKYAETLSSAQKLNEALSNVEVTEETIKTNKKLVAQVRKEADKLDDVRKKVKSEINAPYVEFEKLVKEITSTVKQGEDLIRQQVREFEEAERQEKYEQLLEIINLRLNHYTLIQQANIDIDLILEPKLLNKSVSMNKAEEQIVEKLEHINQSIQSLQTMEHASELVYEYSSNLDMNKAITTVNNRHKALEQMETHKPAPKVTASKTYTITVYNSDDYIKLTQFMNENNITYK